MAVPNQRQITINKEPTNKQNLYTANNLAALDEAARRLQSKGGFKLYMYLAKNQDKYKFDLSSSDFMLWSGLGIKAYRTAFEELKEHGYLVMKENTETVFSFYDKAQYEEGQQEIIEIEYIPETVETIRKVKEEFYILNKLNSVI